MSERINNIILAKNMLENTRHRLKQLKKIPLLKRGHIDNEDLLKLEFREKQLKSAIKLLKKQKPSINPTESNRKKDREYSGEYI